MKLTNRQLDVLISKVFNEISEPIITENKKVLKEFKPNKNLQYFRDVRDVRSINEKIEELEKQATILKEKYKHSEYNGFNFGYNPLSISEVDSFSLFLANKEVKFKTYPSKDELEAEIIIAGIDGIKDLIQTLKEKYK